jgi:hypothetical protein
MKTSANSSAKLHTTGKRTHSCGKYSQRRTTPRNRSSPNYITISTP